MAYSFSNHHGENLPTRQVPACGIDREAVHRIRQQGRIERAKIIRQGIAMLKRSATAARSGGGLS